MNIPSTTSPASGLARQRMARIGAELFLKAALCAAMMALIAGAAAAFLG